mgnify:CR=1 FL=1
MCRAIFLHHVVGCCRRGQSQVSLSPTPHELVLLLDPRFGSRSTTQSMSHTSKIFPFHITHTNASLDIVHVMNIKVCPRLNVSMSSGSLMSIISFVFL